MPAPGPRRAAEGRWAVMGDGLHGKYIIHKASTGEPVDYPCFVLRIDGSDPVAFRAIYAYAMATKDLALKRDLLALIDGRFTGTND
jgi:hypothetical protein